MPFVVYGAAVAYVVYPMIVARVMGGTADKASNAAILKKSMETLGALDEADMSTFLTSLSQHDKFLMLQASQVVNFEMLGAGGFKLTTGGSRELGTKAVEILEERSKDRNGVVV